MRKYGLKNPYELLKDITRGKDKVDLLIKSDYKIKYINLFNKNFNKIKVRKEDLHKLITDSKLPAVEKERLLKLTPQTYIGR